MFYLNIWHPGREEGGAEGEREDVNTGKSIQFRNLFKIYGRLN
jgi:hypothetical protein